MANRYRVRIRVVCLHYFRFVCWQDVNRYRVKCGGSLGMWESSGWISALDPYGWFQWYCRFYLGRRCTDDERQIQRWLGGHGPKGRFRLQLMNKVRPSSRETLGMRC